MTLCVLLFYYGKIFSYLIFVVCDRFFLYIGNKVIVVLPVLKNIKTRSGAILTYVKTELKFNRTVAIVAEKSIRLTAKPY